MPKTPNLQSGIEKNWLFIGVTLLVATALSFGARSNSFTNQPLLVTQTDQQNTQVSTANCLADECLAIDDITYPVAVLPEAVVQALELAIEDEYKALATYESVIAKFGQVRPFSMIIGAEEQHIASLKAIYDKYGLIPPENTWKGTLSVPPTLQQSCQAGVEAEIVKRPFS